MTATLPRLVVLGAPKAGTTTLAAWWDAHEDGYTPPEKEVSYFDLHVDRGEDWYRSRYAPAGERVGCDATPAYLYSDAALDRIAALLPDARLVVVLREPASRVWSHWHYNRAMGIDPRAFSRVVREEAADESSRPRGLPIGYLTGSRYLSRLEAVAARFPREQLLVLFQDELRADPDGVAARLFVHGGIAPRAAPGGDAAERNVGRVPRSAHLQALLLRAAASGRFPERPLRAARRANLRPGAVPPLTGADRVRLRAVFAADLDPLAAWLGRPLPASWYGA